LQGTRLRRDHRKKNDRRHREVVATFPTVILVTTKATKVDYKLDDQEQQIDSCGR